ncbi:MAG: penicillin-binding protein 2, partial [Lachnospiraceae bacterium]|nr:penicillin-binding protein 2 [Lachnospiraceae bacterium]
MPEEERIRKNTRTKKLRKKTIRQIYLVTGLFTAAFVCMMGYTCYYAMTHKQEMINNSYNSRQEMLINQNMRGTIYSSDRQILAQTVGHEDASEKREYPYGSMFSHV